LVFTQYEQQEDERRIPLPRPNIDTGMGLERTVAALQGKASVYECDLFAPIIECVSRLAGKKYGEDAAHDRAISIVAEHGRAATFLIGDGVFPSNEGRGYVLRRVIRRAALFGRKLGLEGPFLGDVAQATVSEMGQQYPELVSNKDAILSAIEAEEERFGQTLNVGLNLLDGIIEEIKGRRDFSIHGDYVFRLYDTYGFPPELTAEVAAENGLTADLEGFEAEMERQRARARAAQKGVSLDTLFIHSSVDQADSRFVGCDKLSHSSSVEWLGSEGESQPSVSRGKDVEVVVKETPFYGEMGGQVGDTGEIRGENGRVIVTNTVCHTVNGSDLIVHQGKVVEGTISVGEKVEAIVDEKRRLDIARNHTATHLLQAALRQVLGSQVQQSGSLVSPEHLRFDFTHLSAITKEQLTEVQHLVNDMVRQNLTVGSSRTSYGEAIDRGALAFFGDKYGEEVTVLEIGEPAISAELCGGTHVKATGEIGFFLILGDSSIGAGTRRIEAVTGRGAEELVEGQVSIVEDAARELRVQPSDIKSRISALQAELDAERKSALSLERELLRNTVDSLIDRVESINGVSVLAAKTPASNMDSLRHAGDLVRERVGSAVIVLGAVFNDRPNFVAMVTPDLVARGLKAGDIVKQVAAVTGGSGGGKPELGQAGGKDKGKIDDALNLVRELVRSI
jgi:alanyl-tRNA synthetase